MSDLSISFTECAVIPQEPQLVIPAVEPADSVVLTVRSTGKSLYRYLERAGRRFVRWITVRANEVYCRVFRRTGRRIRTGRQC